MPLAELEHLELLAEVDALLADVRAWGDRTPDWAPARQCQTLVKRLAERADTLRLRFEAPLVVATLGGTGTGKSSLVNALVGDEVTTPGRERPTTRLPVLICRPDFTPELLGIDPRRVKLVQRDAPALRDLVLLDCPDPDTTEDAAAPETNLARLRELLPHCDVLLVASTQQKYRSARVAAELAAAAPGARLVFVQTHADTDDDVRDDWRQSLGSEYTTGEMFFVDSLTALADARAGLQPRGEFARLLDLLSRELAGAASHRIRRANFLDLVDETLTVCRQRIETAIPAIDQLTAGITEQRSRLAAKLAQQMQDELLGSRRPWEDRVLGEVTSRWGFSPFSCVLRMYQGLGGLITGAALFRVRTPAQLALWGAWEGGRRWRQRRLRGEADRAGERAVEYSGAEADLRTAAIIVDGYAADAGLPREKAHLATVEREAASFSQRFVSRAAAELQGVVARLAERHSGWFTRACYELLLLAMIGVLVYRFGRNFFYDSWLGPEFGWTDHAQPLLGVDFFIGAGLVLLVWSGLLIGAFSLRLRRGMSGAVRELAERWREPSMAAELFAGLEGEAAAVRTWHEDLKRLEQRVVTLRDRVTQPGRLGSKSPRVEKSKSPL